MGYNCKEVKKFNINKQYLFISILCGPIISTIFMYLLTPRNRIDNHVLKKFLYIRFRGLSMIVKKLGYT
jgi:hypothetical protein